MQVYLGNGTELNIAETKTAVALGNFDAMHIGHIGIIQNAVDYAKENGIKSLVYMFSDSPAEFITGKKIPAVNSMEKRLEILQNCGVDIVVAEEFGSEIMNMSCENFADKYLKDRFNAAYVAVGYNYRFGKGGAGDAEMLKKLCAKRGIEACAIPEIKVNGKTVSSTVIRKLIADGNPAEVAELMGRFYSISGKVVRGNGIGKKALGFPTANIPLPKDSPVPKFGVYVSRTFVDGSSYPSITNIGGKPTIEENTTLIETHIDGDFPDLYGINIEIEICDFIRDIIKFEGKDALIIQLEKDKKHMREYFKQEV